MAMISSKLTRAAHRATASLVSSPSAAAAISTTSAASTALPCLAARSGSHQRRPSSSKASCPPDSTARGKPAPAAKAVASTEGSEARSSPLPSQRAGNGKGRARGGYKRVQQVVDAKDAVDPVDQFASLPSVPSIQNLDAKDLGVSAFFSLHRPISLTTTIPPPSTAENFNAIFSTPQQSDPWENGNSAERKPEDVIYILHSTIETLENGSDQTRDDGVRWEVVHESPSNNDAVKHLDGNPRVKSLDELVAQFRPFRAPPPPQPFGDAATKPAANKKAAQHKTTSRRPKQRSYETKITVTESTWADGKKTYTASSTPIVRLPDLEESTSKAVIQEPHSQFRTFRERKRRRQQSYQLRKYTDGSAGPRIFARRAPTAMRQERIKGQFKMFLISVKRQRKLKMKKHKYKKLMKRTRNLRRRLDRA